jgi:hypothetical protein
MPIELDTATLDERLTPEGLPRVAFFLATYLHEDLEPVHGSAAKAAYNYVAEAELDELEELGAEWEILKAAAHQLPLARLNRILRERFKSSWYVNSATEIDAVGYELERALRE